MHRHKTVYYTGKSSRGYDAVLSLRGDFLYISYLNEGEEPIYVQWNPKEVRKLSSTGSLASFQYGSFPYQTLATDDPAALGLLQLNQKFLDKQYSRLLGDGWGLKAGLVTLFVALVILFYFVVIPGTASFLAGQLPQQVEVELGEQLYNTVMIDREKDERLSRLANQFAAEIDFKTDYPIQIAVVKSSEINAFAMPGGHVVIYDGLFYQLESPEAFAALLGHEVAHVKYRHSLKSISRTLSSYLFVSLVMGDINGITSILVENADMLNRMSYSRELEQAADREALAILQHNQLDQTGLVQLMETLQNNHEYEPLQLLSSHPLTEDRIAFAREHVNKQQSITNKAELQKIWEDMKSGE